MCSKIQNRRVDEHKSKLINQHNWLCFKVFLPHHSLNVSTSVVSTVPKTTWKVQHGFQARFGGDVCSFHDDPFFQLIHVDWSCCVDASLKIAPQPIITPIITGSQIWRSCWRNQVDLHSLLEKFHENEAVFLLEECDGSLVNSTDARRIDFFGDMLKVSLVASMFSSVCE